MTTARTGPIVEETRPAVDAATVIVARDGPEGLEILMQERHLETDFVGGALVFPGGRVEDADRALRPDLSVGGDVEGVASRLGADERGARGLLVAAARESFEEAGILFARHRDGATVGPDVLERAPVREARAELAARGPGGDLAALLESQQLQLTLDAFIPFAWWVTPDGMHRRYDTRFFVARVPQGQRDAASSDEVETVSARWLRPRTALEDGASGRSMVIFPTRRVLTRLAAFEDVDALVAGAAEARIERIQPTIVMVDGEVRVQHPDGSPPEAP